MEQKDVSCPAMSGKGPAVVQGFYFPQSAPMD